MKKIALCLALAGLLGACDGRDEPVPQTQASPEPEARAQVVQDRAPSPGKPVPAPEGRRGVDALVEAGVSFDFPHEVLYDILDISAGGTPRHRVLVEVSGGGFEAAVAKFGQSLERLGYQVVSEKKNDGRIDLVYTADGKPTYYLIMQPAGMGPKLRGENSNGSIHVMWNIPHGAT